MRTILLVGFAGFLALGAGGLSAQLAIDTTMIRVTTGGCGGGPLQKLRASAGSGDYQWAVVGGTLPPDMTLEPDGNWGGRVDRAWVRDRRTTTADIQVTDIADGTTAQSTVLFEGHPVNIGGA